MDTYKEKQKQNTSNGHKIFENYCEENNEKNHKLKFGGKVVIKNLLKKKVRNYRNGLDV